MSPPEARLKPLLSRKRTRGDAADAAESGEEQTLFTQGGEKKCASADSRL